MISNVLAPATRALPGTRMAILLTFFGESAPFTSLFSTAISAPLIISLLDLMASGPVLLLFGIMPPISMVTNIDVATLGLMFEGRSNFAVNFDA